MDGSLFTETVLCLLGFTDFALCYVNYVEST